MVEKVKIERECEHKIIVKQGLVIIITLTEFISDLSDIGKETKYAAINVSLINDNNGPQISKISGLGETNEEAYNDCLNRFNRNLDFYMKENEVLLCCENIPFLRFDDLKDFYLTRIIKFSWKYDKNKEGILKAYVRQEGGILKYTYDGVEECYEAESDKKIIEYILSHNQFEDPPEQTSIRRRNRLFYPTINEFLR